MPTSHLPPASPDRLARWKAAFAKVGWFIPAYVSTGTLDQFARLVDQVGDEFDQSHLEAVMEAIYAPERVVAMTLHRYPQTAIIKDFSVTITEAVQAHLIGLHHIAIGGLVPAIEGIGKRFCAERGLQQTRNSTKLFKQLMDDIKRESLERNIGVTPEVEAMMDAFSHFTTEHLYAESTTYPLSDKTNRHGITHGDYADADYGSPLNFYKAISAIDVMTFVTIFRHPGSVFVPEMTPECEKFIASAKAQVEAKRSFYGPESANENDLIWDRLWNIFRRSRKH